MFDGFLLFFLDKDDEKKSGVEYLALIFIFLFGEKLIYSWFKSDENIIIRGLIFSIILFILYYRRGAVLIGGIRHLLSIGIVFINFALSIVLSVLVTTDYVIKPFTYLMDIMQMSNWKVDICLFSIIVKLLVFFIALIFSFLDFIISVASIWIIEMIMFKIFAKVIQKRNVRLTLNPVDFLDEMYESTYIY